MSIFNSNDYRSYLKSYIQSLPRKGRGEATKIAQALRIDPTLLSQVFAGKKDLSAEQGLEIATYLGFAEMERDYFLLLIQKERAGTKNLKNHFDLKLADLRTKSLDLSRRMPEHRELSDEDKARFYSTWLYAAIQLFTSLGNGKSLSEIETTFELDRSEAAEVMQFLVATGLCEQNEGLYRMGLQKTHLGRNSPFLRQHLVNWRLRGLRHIEKVKEEEFAFSSPLSISEKDFALVREKMVNLVKEISEIVSQTQAEKVACVNIDFFEV